MGTFSKIKKYSKSSSYIDEKIKSFNEELKKTNLNESPTNSISNVYLKEPEYSYTDTVEPDPILNFEADDPIQSGTDTTGIFDEFGNSIVIDPPGTWEIPPGPTSDPSATLGPMVSYYDSVANRTYLGYVRQSDRSMINLGRINGQLSNWDQSSNFTSYGQLTLAQAQWYYGEYTANKVQDFRVFYSGKSDPTDPYSRVNAKVINTPKGDGDNPWVVKTSSPVPEDTPITIKFYLDNKSYYTGSREPIFYDSNGSIPAGLTVYDTVDFTLPAGQQFVLQQGANSGGVKIGAIGLKWGYVQGIWGHAEPDGDENGAGNGDDYFNWTISINGTDYPLPGFRVGIGALIGIPGGFGGWTKGNPNSTKGIGAKKSTTVKVPNKNSGFDPNLVPGSANPKNQKNSGFLDKLWDGLKGLKNNMNVLKDTASKWMSNTISQFSGVSPQTITSIGNGVAKALQPLANIRGKGLGGSVQLAFHGTSQEAANRILAPVSNLFTGKSGIAGFKPGSTQNIYKTTNVFAAPSGGTQAKGGMIPQAAKEFSQRGGEVGRGSISRAFSPKSTQPGAIIPTVFPKGSGPGMVIPGTKYAEISAKASTATKGTELAQKVLSGSYANSAKAQQLIATGRTTATVSGARGLAVTLGKAAGPAAAALVVADVGIRGASAAKNYSKGDYLNGGLDTAGAILGGLTIIPGPIGWTALGAQLALDGGRALFQKEEYIMEEYLFEEQMNNYSQYYYDMSKLLSQSLRAGLSEIGELSDVENELISNIENGEISPNNAKAIQLILNKIKNASNNLNSEIGESTILSKSRQRIFRDLKKPVVLPEEKKEKIKHRPKVIGAPPRVVGADLMKKAEVPTSFKPMEEKMWGKHEKYMNARASQERKNQILDYVGTSDEAWEWITEVLRNKGKDVAYENFSLKDVKKLDGDVLYTLKDENGNNHYKLQSELNDEIYRSVFGKYLDEQETLQADKDPLFKKVSNRLKKEIDYPDKPSKVGYPNDPPPEMVNGWHPEYGEKADYYKKLDPHSADAMPTTGNPKIDVKVQKARRIKRIAKGD